MKSTLRALSIGQEQQHLTLQLWCFLSSNTRGVLRYATSLHKPNWLNLWELTFPIMQIVLMMKLTSWLIITASIPDDPSCDDVIISYKKLKAVLYWIWEKTCKGGNLDLSEFTIPPINLLLSWMATAKKGLQADSKPFYPMNLWLPTTRVGLRTLMFNYTANLVMPASHWVSWFVHRKLIHRLHQMSTHIHSLWAMSLEAPQELCSLSLIQRPCN